jgi:hypothetical protein
MSQTGQTRPWGDVRSMSGLLPRADFRTSPMQVSKALQAGIGPSIRSKSSPAPENFFAKTPSAKGCPLSGQTVFDAWRWRHLGLPWRARGGNSRRRSGAIQSDPGRGLPHSSASLRSPGRTCCWKFRPKRCCQDELAGRIAGEVINTMRMALSATYTMGHNKGRPLAGRAAPCLG